MEIVAALRPSDKKKYKTSNMYILNIDFVDI